MAVDQGFHRIGVNHATELDLDPRLAGTRDSEGSDPEDPLQGTLGDLDVAHVAVKYLGGVLRDEARALGRPFVGDGQLCGTRLEPPPAEDEQPDADGCDQQHRNHEPEWVRAEHRRVELEQGFFAVFQSRRPEVVARLRPTLPYI